MPQHDQDPGSANRRAVERTETVWPTGSRRVTCAASSSRFTVCRLAYYEVYVPRISRGSPRWVPLFPSYLFVAATTRGWWQARWAPGVVRLIQNTGEEPACIPERDTVNELRSRRSRRSGSVAEGTIITAAAIPARRSGSRHRWAADGSPGTGFHFEAASTD